MLHNNRITQKKKEIHNTQNRGNTNRIWTEIDTDIAMGVIEVF
jgi:hypothetical protein